MNLTSTSLERLRLHAHFDSVLGMLRRRDLSGLSPSQQAARAGHLAELGRYADRGVFPKNRDFAKPTPYFIDAAGTRCAMAHLIEASGERALTERIARERNNAFVRELAGDAALVAWLDRNGLDAAEAAAIQPSYCAEQSAAACACEPANPDLVIVAATAIATQGTATIVRVDEVHGVSELAAGDQVAVEMSATVGEQWYLEEAAAGLTQADWSFTASEGFQSDCFPAPTVRLDAATALEALRSEDCEAMVGARDPSWAEVEECGFGCSYGGSPAPSAALVCAIATAILLARRRG